MKCVCVCVCVGILRVSDHRTYNMVLLLFAVPSGRFSGRRLGLYFNFIFLWV
jgi:hypothetical protein